MKDTYDLYKELREKVEQLIVNTNDMRCELSDADITRTNELSELMTSISNNIKLNNDLSVKKLDLQRKCTQGIISYDVYLAKTLRLTNMQLKLVEIIRNSISKIGDE